MNIGTEELKIVKSVVYSNNFLSLLFKKWTSIAIDLGIPDHQWKAWKKKDLHDDMTLKEILVEMVDAWANAKGSNAHLDELQAVFRNNELTSLAEHLEKELGLSKPQQPKKYCKVPEKLKEFFSEEGKAYAVILTPDTSITCQKVLDNYKNCGEFNATEFLIEASMPGKTSYGYYVVTVDNVGEAVKVLEATKEFSVTKLLIISKEKKLFSKIPETFKMVNIVEDEMEWEDLSPIFKEEIEKRLKEINSTSETACGQVLVDLINRVEIKLFENTIPEELLVSYYIPRKIITRHRLDKNKLLKNDSKNDIFVCSGIGKYTLWGGVETGMTETSSEFLIGNMKENIRFVALENSSDFPPICSKTSKSVHWIEFKNGEVYWVKTHGDIEVIQKMLKVKQLEEYKEHSDLEHLQETDFVNNVIANDVTRVICLSDTPGMGKSVLLAKIAKQLKDKRGSKTGVIFLPINNLIEKMKVLDKESLKSALHQLSCKNNLEKEVISEKLTSSKLEIELLLDGFDEVDLKRSDFASELLQFLQSECTSIRIWISTRPHHLKTLEQELSTIGFNIKPFIETDQINFLTSFWLNKKKDLVHDKLNKFARKVLEKLSTGTSQSEQGSAKEVEIAGIPLQCLMLAEIYEENAVICCGPTECKDFIIDLFVLQDIDSIATLYEKLVERKFQKYETTYSSQAKLDRASLYSMHYKLALELIFPNLLENNIADFFKESVKIEELLNVGLLERKNATSDSNNFIHRTFAEYFCAHFAADKMTKKELLSCDERFINFFYDEFLSISLDNGEDYSKFSFRNFVPCYFLNCLISSSTSNITLPSKIISPEEIRIFLIVCSNYNLQTLFKLFTDHQSFEENVCDIIDEEFFIYSIKQHEFEMFKIILGHFKNHSKLTARLSSNALCAAVESVDAKKLEYFLKVKGLFNKLLGHPDVELNRLFEKYFYRMFDDEACKNSLGTANAIDMINLLIETEKGVHETMQNKKDSLPLSKKPLLDSYQNDEWRLALMNRRTPIQIRLVLIKLGSDLFQRDTYGNNFLHLYATSDKEFIQYFQAISDKHQPGELTELLKMKNQDGFNPLASAFKNKIQLSIKCLVMFKKAGVDFTEVFNGDPLFVLAIQSGNGEEVLQFMIENGVDVYGSGRTYLDFAVAAGNIMAVRLLVTKFKFDVNGPNMNSRSQLDYLFRIWKTHSSEEYFVMAHELSRLGGKLQHTIPENLKKQAFDRRDLNILRFALDQKCFNVNEKDGVGNTLLHRVVKSWPNAIKLVLEFGAKTSAKNKQGLTPLDVALKSRYYIENIQILKPSDDFNWSMISSSISCDDFKMFVAYSAGTISDWNECLSLFKELFERRMLQRSEGFLHSWLELFRFPPPQFNLLIEYICRKQALIEKLTTEDEYGATPLHYAVESIQGIQEKTLKTLQKTIDLKSKDKKGKSLLFYAVEGRQPPEFLELLNQYGGGNFTDKDDNGHGLLHIIVRRRIRDLEMVKFLLKKGADPESVDHNGDTLLHLLLSYARHDMLQRVDSLSQYDDWKFLLDDWYFELAELLLEAGAKPETKNKDGYTFFGFVWKIMNKSWMRPHPQITKVFRLVWKIRDTTQGLSFTSIDLSINQIVELLFDYPDFADEDFVYFTNEILELKNSMESYWHEDYFPFMKWKRRLTSSNFHFLVENLIENGRIQTFFSLAEDEMQALHHVVSEIGVEERTLQLLMEKRIDLGVKCENGWSLLFHAINRDWTTLKYFKLLEKYGGGNLKEKDNSGKTLLHVAVNEYGRGENNSIILEYLLTKVGLDPNESDNEGNTPLHILIANSKFVYYHDITKARVFIEAGAKDDLPNSKGETVAELVLQNKEDSKGLKEHLFEILSTSVDS